MANFQIITDSGSDLPIEMQRKLNIEVARLTLNFRGKELEDSVDSGMKELYDALRAGEEAKTSAVNPDAWQKIMEPVLQQEKDILVLAFSSGLSTTYQSAVIASGELLEKYPQRKIRVVDTRAASLGQGLLIWYACKKRDQGMELDQLADWAEENKLHLCHWFTVDDLFFLKRGGRVSAATAVAGTMLQIKPVMHMDDEGHLINMAKARGRKASIQALAAKMAQTAYNPESQTMFICHGDCLEDAEYLKKLIMEQYHVPEVVINYTGPVIGSHSGPGTLALFFLGEHR